MKISTRGHYGVIAMAQLARQYGKGPVSLSEIAEGENLSLPYLEQIFSPLRHAGIVKGTRGIGGGYVLSKPPEKISVGDIVRILDGPLAPVECASENRSAECCAREKNCITKKVWIQMRESMAQVLDHTSLADFCDNPKAEDAFPK